MAEFGPGDENIPPALQRRHFARSFKAQESLLSALRASGKLESAVRHVAEGDLQNSPLHAVARRDHLGAANAARLLAEARADLEQRNADGHTPLMVALRRHKGNGGAVATALREAGAREPPQEAMVTKEP